MNEGKMNWGTLIVDIWRGCSKKEIIGWLAFVGGFSIFAITQTVLWDMEADKVHMDLIAYRFIMATFFTSLSGLGVYFGYKAVNIGWHLTEEDEFWRAFSGGLFFTLLSYVLTFLEMVIVPLRSVQFYEYLQGICAVGFATGSGMVWYLYAVGYVRKKNREAIEENEETE